VLLAGDSGRNEYAQMPDTFMHGVDDSLAVGPDLLDIIIEVQDPAERLGRRRDVVAF